MNKFIRLAMALTAVFVFDTAMLRAQEVENATAVNEAVDTAQVTVLTLDRALQIALTESPTIKIADSEIEIKRYEKKGSYAQLYPQINASGSYQRNLKKQKMYMKMGGTVQGIEVGMNNSYSGGISLQMPVVSTALWNSLKISALGVELSVEQARSSRLDMVEQVTKAFYQVLLAKESLAVFEAVYKNALDNYNQVEQKYNVGKASEYDYSSSIVSVKNAEPNVFQAENSIFLALWQLKALLGIDLAMEIDCAGTLTDFAPQLVDDINPAGLSTENNSTIKQFDLQLQQLESSIKMQKSAYYPSLNLTGAYNVTAMDDSFDFGNYMWSPYSYAGLTLSIPIFDGGQRRSNVRTAKLNAENLRLQKYNSERNLQITLMQQVSNMRTYIKQYNAAQTTVAEAEKSYNLAQKRFEIGGGTLIEVNNAQLQLTQTQLTRNQAVYDYMSAKASLEKIIGKEYYGETTEEGAVR